MICFENKQVMES